MRCGQPVTKTVAEAVTKVITNGERVATSVYHHRRTDTVALQLGVEHKTRSIARCSERKKRSKKESSYQHITNHPQIDW